MTLRRLLLISLKSIKVSSLLVLLSNQPQIPTITASQLSICYTVILIQKVPLLFTELSRCPTLQLTSNFALLPSKLSISPKGANLYSELSYSHSNLLFLGHSEADYLYAIDLENGFFFFKKNLSNPSK